LVNNPALPVEAALSSVVRLPVNCNTPLRTQPGEVLQLHRHPLVLAQE